MNVMWSFRMSCLLTGRRHCFHHWHAACSWELMVARKKSLRGNWLFYQLYNCFYNNWLSALVTSGWSFDGLYCALLKDTASWYTGIWMGHTTEVDKFCLLVVLVH